MLRVTKEIRSKKLRFETDPHNRLVFRKTGRKSPLSGFRQVLDGTFSIGANNALSYHIKQPLDPDLPFGRQLKLTGKWSLNPNHDLLFTLDSWKLQTAGDELTLRCQLIDAKADSLAASLTTRSSNGRTSIYLLKLEGSWQVDPLNRLSFVLKSASSGPDTLSFDGSWKIGKNYELIYQLRTQTLVFKGHWDIADKTRLAYALDASAFSKPAFIFSGSWKISRSSGLVFEMKQKGGRITSLSLSAQARLSDRDTILLTLKNTQRRSPQAELELSRNIAQGAGLAFLKLLASKGEQGVFIGMGRRW
jgi:hypothetical protein